MKTTVAIVVNEASFFISHRLPIAKAAAQAGYDVSVWCPPSSESAQLEEAGLKHRPTVGYRGKAGVFRELKSLFNLLVSVVRQRPDVLHLVTSKPILFGGIAARIARVPALVAISGLGFVFGGEGEKESLTRSLVIALYRFALGNPRSVVIFQNTSDHTLFRQYRIGSNDRSVTIRGSGADLSAFEPQRWDSKVTTFVLPARMLAEKGVRDFVAAARLVQDRGYAAAFILQGDPDTGNPTAISEAQLLEWHRSGVVQWNRHSSAIGKVLSATDVVVLPSYYREGLPKTLIDAAAAGRPAITTDWPGCRDAILPGETGLLCRIRDPEDLASKMIWYLDHPDEIKRMGKQARAFAEREFDIRSVVKSHLELYERLALMNDPKLKVAA